MNHSQSTASLAALVLTLILGGLFGVLILLGVRTTITGRYAAAPSPEPPLPTPQAARMLDEITLDGTFVSEPRTFSRDSAFTDDLLLGEAAAGEPVVYIHYDEESLNAYVQYWFADDFLAENERLRDASLDLQPGAIALRAEVNLSVGWEMIEMIFVVDESGHHLRFDGVRIGEVTFFAAPESFLAERAATLEDEVNEALGSLRVLHGEHQLAISTIQLLEDEATVIAR